MTGTTVQELETRIQQLSLGDQLWLIEKLAQHVRVKFNDVADPRRENGEQYTNGSAMPPYTKTAHETTEELEQDDEMVDESGIFYIKPDSPLYEDMKQILEDKKQGKLKFHSYEAVFGE